MTEQWRPLSARLSDSPEAWDVHYEGIPAHLKRSLARWLSNEFTSNRDLGPEVQRRLRIPVIEKLSPEEAVFRAMDDDDDVFLDVLDCTLAGLYARHNYAITSYPYDWQRTAEQLTSEAVDLIIILREGSSAWTVDSKGVWCLARVVNQTAQASFEQATSSEADAAALLRAAWRATFKHDPDYSTGYWKAVQAVESAATQRFTPKDRDPSLGKAINHLRDTVNDWTVADLDDKQQTSGETLLAMLRTIWQNHQRHVLEGGRAPEPATQEEAEAVLFLAVTLVQWFQRGYVQKRED